jgi:DNA-directed RNA polymerase
MKRIVIIAVASIVAGKAAKEITIFVQAGRSLESYFFWKQVEHAERAIRKEEKRRRPQGSQQLTGHNTLTRHSAVDSPWLPQASSS